MLFQKTSTKPNSDQLLGHAPEGQFSATDEVETVVGPSVNVEGDFASEGNIIVKGTVAGSVRTSKHLSVELGAKIMANVRAGGAQIAGEVKGNIKIKESLELTSTARIMGDIEAKVLVVAAGALISGKVMMPGLETTETKLARPGRSASVKKADELSLVAQA